MELRGCGVRPLTTQLRARLSVFFILKERERKETEREREREREKENDIELSSGYFFVGGWC
jgi:hypothetical protein